jgi:hypothetical protein
MYLRPVVGGGQSRRRLSSLVRVQVLMDETGNELPSSVVPKQVHTEVPKNCRSEHSVCVDQVSTLYPRLYPSLEATRTCREMGGMFSRTCTCSRASIVLFLGCWGDNHDLAPMRIVPAGLGYRCLREVKNQGLGKFRLQPVEKNIAIPQVARGWTLPSCRQFKIYLADASSRVAPLTQVCLCLTGGGFVGWWGSEESYVYADVETPRLLLPYVAGVDVNQIRGFWQVRTHLEGTIQHFDSSLFSLVRGWRSVLLSRYRYSPTGEFGYSGIRGAEG